MKIKDLWSFIRRVFSEWSEDKVPRLAAALAYYTIFSIPPLLLTIIGFVGYLFGRAAVQKALLDQIAILLNPNTANAIGAILQSASGPQKGGLAAIIGTVVLLLGASGVFGQLQDALNTIWEVKPKPKQGIKVLVQKRLFSFAVVLVLGFLLLVSMVLSTALSLLSGYLQGRLPGSSLVFSLVNFVLPLLVITFLFALMFKFMPDARMKWKDVWLGAAITSLLFNLGKTLIGLYLARSNPASAFGAAASLVLILVWIYYTAQILFLGAEFTFIYARDYGSGIVPEDHAERVTEMERAQQGIPRKEKGREPARREAPLNEKRAFQAGVLPALSMEGLPPDRPSRAGRSLTAFTAILTGLLGILVGLLLGKKG